jgi:hypothetical protein
LIGTVNKTNFKKVRTETVLKLHNTLILPTFLYGSENWTLTASQRRRTVVAEMKLLRLLAGRMEEELVEKGGRKKYITNRNGRSS